MRILRILIILIIVANVVLLAAQNNPFIGKSSSARTTSSMYKKSGIWHTITTWQKEMNSELNRLLKDLKEDFNLKYFSILMLISVLFGVIHAVGPGHGKMIVGAYFLKEKASPVTAIKIGSVLAATHSGLAIILGIVFGFLIKSIKMQGRAEMQSMISIAGGVLITLLGIYYLFSKVKGKEHNHHTSSKNGKGNELLLGVFSGMVPCPISMTIILFSIYLDVFWYGLLSVIMFSVGMAGTVSILGIVTIKSRDFVSRISKIAPQKALKWQKGFGIITSLLIIVVGLNIVIAQL